MMHTLAIFSLLLLPLAAGSFGLRADMPQTHLKPERTFDPFVCIGIYGAGAGSRNAPDRFFYVSHSNHAEEYTVVNETVASYAAKKVATQELMDYVQKTAASLPKGFVRRGEEVPPDQFIPTYVRISFQLASGKTYDWAGYEKQVSTNQMQIIQRIEDIIRTGQSVTNEKPFAFLAAYWLDDRTASQFKRDGLFHAIGAESTSAASTLLDSLRHPSRLIPINRDANPFQPFRRSFQPGRDVLEATFSGKNFQVRSYATTIP